MYLDNYKLKDVFIPVGLADLTFVRRPRLERAVRSWELSEAKHLLIFGHSKSGKTSLWNKYVDKKRVIKIPCSATKTLRDVYSEILYELNSFYQTEITQTQGRTASLKAELCALVGIGKGTINAQLSDSHNTTNKQARISEPNIACTLVIKFLNDTNKIIVLEDFHYATPELKNELSEDLKAFSDEKCPWILVGVQHKTSELLSYNLDLQQRIAEIPVEGFSDDELREIIGLGEIALNLEFSNEIKQRIVIESFYSASIVQNICQRICLLQNITNTQRQTKQITDISIVERACKEIAEETKSYYSRAVKNIALGGRTDASTEKYKWFLKIIKEKDITERGLKNTEVYSYIKQLGHDSIQQGSVTSGLKYLPKLLRKNNLPTFFDFDSGSNTFYLLDKYMKFVFKWIPRLIDDLFKEDDDECSEAE